MISDGQKESAQRVAPQAPRSGVWRSHHFVTNLPAPTKFYVYVLWSETLNVNNRLHEHNSGESVSTKTGIPWIVVHHEEFCTRSDAVKKEKQIKARGIKRYLVEQKCRD
jgi:putative endonuclease